MYRHPIRSGSLLALMALSMGVYAAGFGGGPTSQSSGYQGPGYQGSGYQGPGYQGRGYQQPGYQVPNYSGPAYGQPAQGFQVPSYQGPAYGGSKLPESSGYGAPGTYPGDRGRAGDGPDRRGYRYPPPGAPGQPAAAPNQGYGYAPIGEPPQGGYEGPGYGGGPGAYGPGSMGGAPATGYGYGPVPYGDYPRERGGRGSDGERGGSGLNPMRMMPNPMKMFGGGDND